MTTDRFHMPFWDDGGYDPCEGEGDKEDGWKKCVVCQAFTIDPETECCIHWGKDKEHHEMWYDDKAARNG